MSAQPAAGGVRWMEMLKNGLGAPLVVLALLAMIVVPLAPPVLDALFSFNIAISLVVLLAMIYVKRPHELQAFARSEWVDAPARMLGPLLVRALGRSGAFEAVTDAGSGADAELRLETELVRLQHEFTARPSRVRLTLRVQLSDRARHVLGVREIEAIEEAPSEDPYGGVVAANRAVQEALEGVVSFCTERAAEREARPSYPLQPPARRSTRSGAWLP